MCDNCGCGHQEANITVMGAGVAKARPDHAGDHAADHAGDHAADHAGDYGGEGGRRLAVEQEVLAKNNAAAEHNREHFGRHRILALNLVSSPGAGKTTLLERTILELNGRLPLAVIEGDQQTLLDAQRIERTGVPVVQVNTGAGCHLDAEMIHRALHRLELAAGSRLLIENVGNLVCPAMFDLGEAAKVVIISPTEGEDKPLKYPAMFAAASICVINKIDLLPYLDFDLALCRQYLQQVNPDLQIFTLSAKSGEGLAAWLEWLATAQPPGMAASA